MQRYNLKLLNQHAGAEYWIYRKFRIETP